MDNGYTTTCFRTGGANRSKHGNDVGVLLSYKVYNRATHNINESKIPILDRYKYKINRPTEVDAVGLKIFRIECSDIGELYN